MKRLSLLIIPISLLFLGVFVLTGTKDVEAAYGDRASYTLEPWTFWQTGVTTDQWNQWELNAFNGVYLPDDSDKFPDSVGPDGTTNYLRSYTHRNHFFEHGSTTTHPQVEDPYELTLFGVSHGYIADIESNGWSGKWIPDPTESEQITDPPKWGETTTPQGETTSFVPYLMDNNPYTLRCWTKANGLKKNRTYTWVFDAYIDEGAYMAKLEGNIPASNKYAKIVGTNGQGKILFVRYLDITTTKKRFQFNFDMDSDNSTLKVEMMYGAFLLEGPIIKHEEVVWTGKVHVENCDIIQGNLNEPQVETTTRRPGGGGGDVVWYDEPEKISGVKAKSKAKKSVILSWKREENSTKYQYNYAMKKNFKGGKKKYTTKNKVTIKKLKRKKTYYFRVRGMNDEYTGSWSAKKKCKVK
ncbi:MAG: hypothetical protein J6W35_02165 [Eubacterium sp.]|nr:hypothetical protein [Eubacterium sp.]